MASPAGPDFERYATRLAPVGAVLVVGGIFVGGWGFAAAGLGAFLLLLACYSPIDGLIVLGPFVRAELIRAARTRRLALWRVIYALTALLCLALMVLSAINGPKSLIDGQLIDSRKLARVAENFFLLFAGVQFIYLNYLTIALIAPVAAEEREAKRWDFLLATDLRAREILFGKAVGRLPMVVEPVLATLPVLAVLPLLGGVSPVMVLAVGIATLASIVGTAGVAFFYSVFAPTAKNATDRTMFILIFYVFGTGGLAILATSPLWAFPNSWKLMPPGLVSPIEVGDVVELLAAGNAPAVIGLTALKIDRSVAPAEVLIAEALRKFVAYQIGIGLLFGLTAVLRLRTAIPWQVRAKGKTVTTVTGGERAKKGKLIERPPLREWPVYWWSRYGAQDITHLAFNRAVTAKSMTKLFFLAVACILAVYAINYLSDNYWLQLEPMRGIYRIGVVVFCALVIFPPAFRAVRSVAAERAADTLDALRLTGLTGREILFEKWLGAVMAQCEFFVVLVTLTAAGSITGFVHPLGLVAMALVVPVLSGVSGAIGIYFSVRAKAPGPALRLMVIVAILLAYLLGVIASAVAPRGPAGAIVGFPPCIPFIAMFADEAKNSGKLIAEAFLASFASLVIWGGIGYYAWRLAVKRFESEKHD